MRAVHLGEADLKPIPLGPGPAGLRYAAGPSPWDPVRAVARALDRLQRQQPTFDQEVTHHAGEALDRWDGARG
ncbi:MAG: hypothetical protein J2P45_31335 [Candidatus Dormibacteraeota bacterium]|nr:hypothetical protein [Candidatus Dormibacteraeota bacterium]